jgi:hypothetical protein
MAEVFSKKEQLLAKAGSLDNHSRYRDYCDVVV